MRVHPPDSFDEEFIDEWAAWVLDHGLPAGRQTPSVGEACPIARWVGSELGAVLFVAWNGDGSSLTGEVQVLRRGAGWVSSPGSGGAGWVDPPDSRPPEVGADDVLVIGWHELVSAEWRYVAAYGIAGSAACSVEVLSNGDSTRFPIEPGNGAFVVCWSPDVDAVVRVLDRSGRVLWSHTS